MKQLKQLSAEIGNKAQVLPIDTEKLEKIRPSAYNFDKLCDIATRAAIARHGRNFKLNIDADKTALEKIFAYFLEYESEYERLNINPSNGIILMGGTGTGKTTLNKLMTEWQWAIRKIYLEKTSLYFGLDQNLNIFKSATELANEFSLSDGNGGMRAIQNRVSAGVYCKIGGHFMQKTLNIDDLGREGVLIMNETGTFVDMSKSNFYRNNYGSKVNVLEQIIFMRHEKKYITNISTNLNFSLIGQIYGDYIKDRLRTYNVAKLVGESKRKLLMM